MVAGDQQQVHMPFVSLESWSPYAPLVWKEGFLTHLSGSSIFTNLMKALDILFSSFEFRKQQ